MDSFFWGAPDFSQGLLFTAGNIAFLLEILVLYGGISFLFEAEKTSRKLYISTVAALFGAFGVWIAGMFTVNSLYIMASLVATAFWGTGLTLWLTGLFTRLSGFQKIRNWIKDQGRPILRILGLLLIAGTVSVMMRRSPVFIGLLLALVFKCLHFLLTRRKQRYYVSHSYDEIAEKSGEKKQRSWAVTSVLLISAFFMLLYLTWRIFFTIPYRYGILSLIASVLLLIVEVLGAIDSFTHYKNMGKIVEYPLPEVPEDQFPDVDIFVSTYTETTELLRKTLFACQRMDYPDKAKVHIYLCDDGHREEMEALAGELGVNYLKRDTHEGAKAGNLNYALAHSSSPYIVTFDADMQPRSCFLLRTIPYFVDAELKSQSDPEKKWVKLGFVQTPQSFYDLDLFQYHLCSEDRIPNEQDYFYRYIQVARTKTNSVIYGGSNTVMSRKALNAAGGFYTKTITEDFATGMLIEKAGFVSLGTSEPLASGMNPRGLRDLIQQRVRWARGVIDTGRKMHIFTSSNMTTAQKMNYWSSVWYWYASLKRLAYILFPILSAFFGVTMFKYILPQMLVFWLPMYIMTRVSQRVLGYRVRTAKWTEIYETAMFPFLLLPVILESLGISLKKFKVTNKEQRTQKSRRFIYMLPFLILIALSLMGIANCVQVILEGDSFGPALLIFWLVNNLYLLVMALFFTGGRRVQEGAAKISVDLPGDLVVGEDRIDCKVSVLSEEAVTLETQTPLPDADIATIDLKTDRYQTQLQLKRMQKGKRRPAKCRYTFAITACEDYDQLLAILYDRVPARPDRIKSDGGIFADLWLNFWRRLWFFSERT